MQPTPERRKLSLADDDDTAAQIERLWADYKAQADADVREQLILHYSPLVKYVAGRVAVGRPPGGPPAPWPPPRRATS